MKSIYKTAVIIGYKESFADWYNQTIDKHSAQKRVTISELNESPLILLLGLFKQNEEFEKQFLKIKSELFCFIMNEWCNDEQYWHKNISANEFDKFFDVKKTNRLFDCEDKIESFSLTFDLKESLKKFKKANQSTENS